MGSPVMAQWSCGHGPAPPRPVPSRPRRGRGRKGREGCRLPTHASRRDAPPSPTRPCSKMDLYLCRRKSSLLGVARHREEWRSRWSNNNNPLLCSRLSDRAGSPSLHMDQEKRMRREIANSNERRRMQSINAGFQSLRTLLPHHEGEKLSKVRVSSSILHRKPNSSNRRIVVRVSWTQSDRRL